MDKFNDAVMIPIGNFEVNDFNPNEQTAETFNELVKEIQQEGFDEPLKVVPTGEGESQIVDGVETGTARYRIIGGEHRYHAGRMLKYTKLPAIIKPEWDDRTQRIKTVRLNMLRGHPDDVKLQRLVGGLAPNLSQVEGLRSSLAMSERDFARCLQPRTIQRDMRDFNISPRPKPTWVLIETDQVGAATLQRYFEEAQLVGRLERSDLPAASHSGEGESEHDTA